MGLSTSGKRAIASIAIAASVLLTALPAQAAPGAAAASKAVRNDPVPDPGVPDPVPTVMPVPRDAAGNLVPPTEECSLDDPTDKEQGPKLDKKGRATHCVTPRMQHLLDETKRMGITNQPSGCFGYSKTKNSDHPKGRGCDFEPVTGKGIQRPRTKEDRAIGDAFAQFFVDNAQALGIKYVIWYKMQWKPATPQKDGTIKPAGWYKYGPGKSKNPSVAHTDHVHVSVM